MDRPLSPRPRSLRRRLLRGVIVLTGLYLLLMPIVALVSGTLAVRLEAGASYPSWREARAASNYSVGLAPAPATTPEPVIQVYSARTWGFKKAFAVHTWVAVKPADAANFEVFEVIGWRQGDGRSVVVSSERAPDQPWYGNEPGLLLDLRGAEHAPLIEQIRAAAQTYPWPTEYDAWPGPNSNTFVAWIGREVPGLGLDLPSTAIGKDYLPIDQAFARSVSGGYQVTLLGLASLSVGAGEGVEVNLLGLNLELDLLDLAIEIPGYGRIGAAP